MHENLEAPLITFKITGNDFRYNKENQKKYPNIQYGRFTCVRGGDKEIVTENWNQMIQNGRVRNPKKLQEELIELKSKACGNLQTHKTKWKLSFVGTFLSRKLSHLRHPINVLEYALEKILNPKVSGSFGPEEDQEILKEIGLHGNTFEVQKKLAKLLNRTRQTIMRRIEVLKRGTVVSGKWTLNEIFVLIDCLFPDSSFKTIDYICKIDYNTIRQSKAADFLNRDDKSPYNYFRFSLKTLLLRYHYGLLYTPWKYDVLEHVATQKIMGIQELNNDLSSDLILKKHTGITKGTITRFLIKCHEFNRDLPLYICAQKNMHKYKGRPDCTPKQQKFREAIIDYYDPDKKILPSVRPIEE